MKTKPLHSVAIHQIMILIIHISPQTRELVFRVTAKDH